MAEKVLVCKKEEFLKSNYEYNDKWYMEGPEWFFAKRRFVETSPDHIQLIPYAVLIVHDKIPVFKRVSSDPRLQGKSFIGVGGHINPIDQGSSIEKTVANTLNREISEEISPELWTHTIDIIDKGTIYMDKTPVDRVHAGLLKVIKLDPVAKEIIINTDTKEIKFLYFIDINQDPDAIENLENWSKFALLTLQNKIEKQNDKIFPWQ